MIVLFILPQKQHSKLLGVIPDILFAEHCTRYFQNFQSFCPSTWPWCDCHFNLPTQHQTQNNTLQIPPLLPPPTTLRFHVVRFYAALLPNELVITQARRFKEVCLCCLHQGFLCESAKWAFRPTRAYHVRITLTILGADLPDHTAVSWQFSPWRLLDLIFWHLQSQGISEWWVIIIAVDFFIFISVHSHKHTYCTHTLWN